MRALVGILAASDVQIPPHVQAMLHGNVAPHPPSEHSEDSEMDDPDDDYKGDWGDQVPPPSRSDFDDAFIEEAPKRARAQATPSTKDHLRWAHANAAPFRHIAWGRVKGDGNCLWRSLGRLSAKPESMIRL